MSRTSDNSQSSISKTTLSDTPCICIPFFANDRQHPSERIIISLYVYYIDGEYEIVNFEHQDATPSDITLDDVQLHPDSLIFNHSTLLYKHAEYPPLDLNTYLQYHIDDWVDIMDVYPETIRYYYSKYGGKPTVGKIIPLSKHIEMAESIINIAMPVYKKYGVSDKCREYCTEYSNTLHVIERVPVMFDGTERKQHYNWYTATSRPSNSWDGLNFLALNKSDGTRKLLTSSHAGGKILQFDYEAFHVKLLAKLLNYEFTQYPYDQIKADLGLDIESVDDIKTMVFKNLYGGITQEFIAHPFFMGIQAMIDELYHQYTTDGYVESWFYNKRFIDIPDITPNKLFNYYLQSLETEYNIRKIQTILPILRGKKTTLSLYMYDAFVFDVHPSELDIVEELRHAFETDGMRVKASVGDSFGDMVAV